MEHKQSSKTKGIFLSQLPSKLKPERQPFPGRYSLGSRPLPVITFLKIQMLAQRWLKKARNSKHRYNVLK